jgi:hypothetical protein
VQPRVGSLGDLREMLRDPARWQSFRAQLAEYDSYYDQFLMRRSMLDSSALVRLVRRAYAQSRLRSISADIEDRRGFKNDPQIGHALAMIVNAFAATAREDGRHPIILLIQDQPHADHLYKLLSPFLLDRKIPFLSTHEIAPATQRQHFVGDGHFTDAANSRISARLLEMIRTTNPGSTPSEPPATASDRAAVDHRD